MLQVQVGSLFFALPGPLSTAYPLAAFSLRLGASDIVPILGPSLLGSPATCYWLEAVTVLPCDTDPTAAALCWRLPSFNHSPSLFQEDQPVVGLSAWIILQSSKALVLVPAPVGTRALARAQGESLIPSPHASGDSLLLRLSDVGWPSERLENLVFHAVVVSLDLFFAEQVGANS